MAVRAADRRKKAFMKGIDADDARRKREDNIIELRKNKRDENLQKKRMIYAAGGDDSSKALEDSNRNSQKVSQSWSRLVSGCQIAFLFTLKVKIACVFSCSWTTCPQWCKEYTVRILPSSLRQRHSSGNCFQ